MWKTEKNFPQRGGFSTPPPSWKSRPFRSPKMPFSERKRLSPNSVIRHDLFHVVHKVPSGDSPYVKAKQVQLIDKDPSRAISLFWAAINAGDRVDSALKDMAVVMKQLDRSDEAIEAIKSFRHLCPYDSQESIDNVMVELYKRSGRIDEEIEMLKGKLRQIEEGKVFGGKRTKSARSQGRKVLITIEQETSRVLGNLGWAYLQQNNVRVAEGYYKKALYLDPDNNKKCNLAICMIHMNRIPEAKALLHSVRTSRRGRPMEEAYEKSFERAVQMLAERESQFPFHSAEQEDENCIKRESNEIKSSIVRDAHCVSGEFYINEDVRDICLVSDGDFQFKSFGAAKSSHDHLHCNKWSKGPCIENLGKKKSSFPMKMKENRDAVLRVDGNSNCRTLYSSPIPAKTTNVEVPFTQPKNCSWGFNNGHQPSWQNDATSESEETEATSNYKAKYRCVASNADEHEVPFTQPRSYSWDYSGGCQRKGTQFRDFTGGSNRKLSFEDPIQAPEDTNFARSDLSRAVTDDSDLGGKPTSYGDDEYNEIEMQDDSTQAGSPFTDCRNDSMMRKEEFLQKNSMDNYITVDEKFKQISLTDVGCKKSWADMAEEEEDEEETEEEPSTGRSRADCLGDWSTDEDFNDENRNSNIFHKNHSPSNQVEETSQIKFGSLDIKDGNEDTDDIVMSRNPTVRRSLFFDQQTSSPLPRNNSELENRRREENVNLARRNRLQVFQEITVKCSNNKAHELE